MGRQVCPVASRAAQDDAHRRSHSQTQECVPGTAARYSTSTRPYPDRRTPSWLHIAYLPHGAASPSRSRLARRHGNQRVPINHQVCWKVRPRVVASCATTPALDLSEEPWTSSPNRRTSACLDWHQQLPPSCGGPSAAADPSQQNAPPQSCGPPHR